MLNQYYKSSHLLMLLVFGLLWSCNVEQISSDLDPTEISSRMGEDGCQVRIVGKIVSTQDLLGVEGATISSAQFPVVVQTDEDGNFQIDISIEEVENIQQVDVDVELNGYITNTFPVDLNQVINQADCPLLTTLTWDIGITPLENSVEVRNDRPTNISIEDTVAVVILDIDAEGNIIGRDTVQQVNKYRVEIPKVIASQPGIVSITPNHNFAYGLAMVSTDETRAEIGQFHFEATEGTRLNGKIKIIFQSETPIQSGDVIDFSNDRSYVVAFDTDTDIITVLTGSFEDLTIYNSSNVIEKGSSTPTSGATIGTERVENCNCGDAISYIYTTDIDRNPQINIDFPAGLSPSVQSAIYQDLFECLNAGADNDVTTVTQPVTVDKCEVMNISTTLIGTVETGVIYGYNYTYSVFNGGETSISTSICPTTTACHQGCP
ncbi:MAG: hypothetical protein AB8G86_13915 [Saprospiraceae bacterium]